MKKSFSHLSKDGDAKMVDVGAKKPTHRFAHARASIKAPENIIKELKDNKGQTKKGSVFQTAIIAGIMAAKKTGELIPLCHPIGMDNCDIKIKINKKDRIVIDCKVSVFAKTGIEMEAMTGASVAALTIYDMCKALSHRIVIKSIKLMEKTGGKKDFKIS